jgi:hypothetical protein
MNTPRWLLAGALAALAMGAGACHRNPTEGATGQVTPGEPAQNELTGNAMVSGNTMGAENSNAVNDASASGAASQ